MHENFLYFLRTYQPVETTDAPDPNVLSRLSKIYPPSLLEFIGEYGFASFNAGLFQFCDPEDFCPALTSILKGDPELDPAICHVVGYTAFGTLICWSETHLDFEIELPLQSVYCSPLTIPGWAPTASADHIASGLVPDREDAEFFDFAGEPMFARCVSDHGQLARGECYGFVPALALSGAFGPLRQVENVRRLSAVEHFNILAQLGGFNLMKITLADVVPVRPIGMR